MPNVVSSEVLFYLGWVNNGDGVWISPPASGIVSGQIFYYPAEELHPYAFERTKIGEFPDQWKILSLMATLNIPMVSSFGQLRMDTPLADAKYDFALSFDKNESLTGVRQSMANAAGQRLARRLHSEWYYSDTDPKRWRKIPAPATVGELLALLAALKIPLKECFTR